MSKGNPPVVGSVTFGPQVPLGARGGEPELKVAHHTSRDAEELSEARREIERLTAEVSQRWQPIETAPQDGTRVLLFATRGAMLAPRRERLVGAYNRGWWSGRDPLSHVTHWMPLPPIPTVSGSQEQNDG